MAASMNSSRPTDRLYAAGEAEDSKIEAKSQVKARRRKSSQIASKKPSEEVKISKKDSKEAAKTRKSTELSKTVSLSLMAGDEKDFDKTQWDRTIFGVNYSQEMVEKELGTVESTQRSLTIVAAVDNEKDKPSDRPVQVSTPEKKTKKEENVTKTTVSRMEDKKREPPTPKRTTAPTTPAPKTSEIPKKEQGRKVTSDYQPADMLIMLSAWLVQLFLIGCFLALAIPHVYRETPTTDCIVTICLMFLIGLVIICSIFTEVWQYICWRRSGKTKTGAYLSPVRITLHVGKILLTCAAVFLVLEGLQWHGAFTDLMRLLIFLFMSLIVELYLLLIIEKDKTS